METLAGVWAARKPCMLGCGCSPCGCLIRPALYVLLSVQLARVVQRAVDRLAERPRTVGGAIRGDSVDGEYL